MAGAFSIHGVVAVGVSEAPVLRLLGEGLNAVKNSSVKSSIMARREIDAPL
jgi:hypothetical protein